MNKLRKILAATAAGAALALTATGLAYAANPDPGNVAPIAQKRLVDVPGKAITVGQTQTLQVAGQVGIPANATGVTGSITALPTSGTAWLVAWDGVLGAPGTPTVNAPASSEPSGQFHVALNNGTMKVYSKSNVRYLITITAYDVPEEPVIKPAPTTYGVGQIWINTKYGNTKWAVFSTPELGGPEGDQASGVFRFTCTLEDGCDLTLEAYSTADGWSVYPRILLTREDNTNGQKYTCEYADGVNNDNGAGALTDTATVMNLGIGSTADCGGNQTGTQPNGVDHINVPGASGQGLHYDAEVTLTFVKA